MLRWVITMACAAILTACATRPVVDNRYAPDHVIVQHHVGFGESPTTVAASESAAREACDNHNRTVKLPSKDNFCVTRHWFFGTCLTHRYTFECLP